MTAYSTWGPTGPLARTTPPTHAERWYLFDPTGSVALRLDATGQTVAADRYDAYGVRLAGGEPGDPVGYKGQSGYYTDAETGLILCTWRYFDPRRGAGSPRTRLGMRAGATYMDTAEVRRPGMLTDSGYGGAMSMEMRPGGSPLGLDSILWMQPRLPRPITMWMACLG